MNLSVITPEKQLIEGAEVSELIAPGIEGQLDVLPSHANFVTELETGVIKWKSGDSWTSAALSYGWLEVNVDGAITILADVADLGQKVDKTRAQKAKEKALSKIEQGGLTDVDFAKYELKLLRADARLKAANT